MHVHYLHFLTLMSSRPMESVMVIWLVTRFGKQNIVRIFETLRYRDEDPIVEKPGAVIIANYASVTIISNKKKHIRSERH